MSRPPMPVVVGAPRSGTTLLRLMLDAHPQLAIPPETGFLPAAAALGDAGPDALADLLTAFPPDAPNWADFGLDAEQLRGELLALPEFSVADGVRCFYRAYAARHGKPRWGEKTPGYVHHLPEIEALLPEARFVHLIRDGRDVAVSLRERWFSPGHAIDVQARFWAGHVRAGRAGGGACRHYLEVRYERLVTEPEPVLRELCAFLELPFDAAMVRAHERAPGRLAEHGERRTADGRLVVSREQRRAQQAAATRPPDPAKIGSWRSALTPADIRGFAAEAGDLLDELGYSSPPRRHRLAAVRGWGRRPTARR